MPTYFYCNQTEQFTLVSYISALLSIIYATTDEAYVLQIFFGFFLLFSFFPFATKIPDNRSWEQLNGFS